jgi:hypothetical protein
MVEVVLALRPEAAMRVLGITAAVVLVALLVGLAERERRESHPWDDGPLYGGPGDPVPLRAFRYDNVGPMGGGTILWARADGYALVASIRYQGMTEKHYKLQLQPEQIAEVERLVGAHRFLHLNPDPGPRPEGFDFWTTGVTVVPQSGTRVEVRRWMGFGNKPRFNAVADYLDHLCCGIERQKPDWEGPPRMGYYRRPPEGSGFDDLD